MWFGHYCDDCRQEGLLFYAYWPLNTLGPRQNGRHFADDIFKCIFVNENVWILIEISLKFVPKGLINSIPALVQTMAWCRSGDKPLSEPMMVSYWHIYIYIYICVTRPQWFNFGPRLLLISNGRWILHRFSIDRVNTDKLIKPSILYTPAYINKHFAMNAHYLKNILDNWTMCSRSGSYLPFHICEKLYTFQMIWLPIKSFIIMFIINCTWMI